MKKEKNSTEKKEYHKPELSLYGDIHQLTHASKSGKHLDGTQLPPQNPKVQPRDGRS